MELFKGECTVIVRLEVLLMFPTLPPPPPPEPGWGKAT